ncbi:MAG TPA: ABC-type transport auxiliary lipoprotein family protein [Burkholderiales bacterium]|nr:ABC-type transport auxiliary lipoprotein family protein [Burkholderiales bacterium]
MSARPVRLTLALVASLGIAGCALEAPVSAVPTSYDLGPVRAYARSNPAIAGVVLVAPVRAPAWLEDDAIAYRLNYEDAARTQTYAMSRWAAEPAALITDRLRSRLAAVARGVVSPAFAARSDYTLRIELEDFSQHFGAPGDSRALLRARATLLSSDRRVVLAQRVFDVERPAAPNAQGAVKALTEAADAFLEDVVKWTIENAAKEAK